MKYKILILISIILILTTSLVSATYDLSVKQITVNPNKPVEGYNASTAVTVTNNGPENLINGNVILKLQFGDSNLRNFQIINLSAGKDVTFTTNHIWTTNKNYTLNANLSGMTNDSESNNNEKTLDITVVKPEINLNMNKEENLSSIYRSETKKYQVKITNEGNVPAELVNAYISDLEEINGNESINNNNISIEFPKIIKENNYGYENLSISIPSSVKPDTYTGNLTTAYKELNGSISTIVSQIKLTVENHAPEIENLSDNKVYVIIGDKFSYQIKASDKEKDPLTFKLTSEPIGMTINETTGLIEWTPTIVTTHTVTVEVSDGYNTSQTSFEVESKIDAPELTASTDEVELGNSDSKRGEQVTSTFTIQNTGTQTLTDLTVRALTVSGYNLSSDYNAVVTISKTTLKVGEEAIVSIGVTIPTDEDSERHQIGKIRISGKGTTNDINKEVYLSLEAESHLKISEVRIYANGDDEKLDDGETYDKLKEGDHVKLVITLENTYPSDSDTRIEDAYVKLSDDNWDIDEESNKVNIREDDDKDVEVSFTIDQDLDEDTNQITIEAYGQDENDDFEHYDKYTINLEIDREDHDIKILSWRIENNPVNCKDGFIRLSTTIKNEGLDDEDEALLRVYSSRTDLNWQKVISNIELDSGDKETYTFDIPLTNVKAGTHYIQMESYYDTSKKTDNEVATVNVVCDQTNTNNDERKEETKNESMTVIVKPTNSNSNNKNIDENNNGIQYGQPVTAKESFTDSNTYLVILIVLILLVITLIILLAANLLTKNSKPHKKG